MRFNILTIVVLLLVAGVAIVRTQKPRRDESPDLKFFMMSAENGQELPKAIAEFSDGEVHDDPDLKCYMNCLFHELNVIDDDGEMHMQSFLRLLPDELREIGKPMLDTCVQPEGETQCDRAWWFHKCWKTTDPMHYFLP